jgi:hypothetical protein
LIYHHKLMVCSVALAMPFRPSPPSAPRDSSSQDLLTCLKEPLYVLLSFRTHQNLRIIFIVRKGSWSSLLVSNSTTWHSSFNASRGPGTLRTSPFHASGSSSGRS